MIVPPAEPGFLAPWMTRQRWFANKGALPALEEIGRVELHTDEPGVGVAIHLLLDHTAGKPALYQVPLTYRTAPLPQAEAAMVGMLGSTYVYDGPHDGAFTSALLGLITANREERGPALWIRGQCTDSVASGFTSRVLTGEQSNTSIIYETGGTGTPVICKLFRAIHHGDNPDVELQTALALAGSHSVPRSVGNVVAEWNDRGRPDGRARGHLAFAQEFLPGVRDAWRVALDGATAGLDFGAAAYAIGAATAEVHATLATALPTAPVAQSDIDETIGQMQRRLDAAIAEVPALQVHAASVRAVFEAAGSAPWPAQQRIHGDLHLGQVLSVPGRNWMLVDFEGEPLRPMHERSRLDSPMRDVAGMLRSFDYVDGSLRIDGRGAPEAWATTARSEFLRGYGDACGSDPRENRALLDAFELDKALYETVYEARNRPSWLRIPVGAIERLAARSLA